MPYQKLKIDTNTPPLVRKHIIGKTDDFLADIHGMLLMPGSGEGMEAGMQFLIALGLLCVVDGVAQFVYPREASLSDCYKMLLRDKYPWLQEKITGEKKIRELVDTIYWYRNNLVHFLGTDTDSPKKILQFSAKHKKWVVSKDSITDALLEVFENTQRLTTPWDRTIDTNKDGQPTLNVLAFYRSVRHMIVELTQDQEIMTRAEGYLLHKGYTI